MTSDGSPYSRFQRALRAQSLPLIHATADELGWIALRDALHILLIINAKDEERFEPAAVRWAGRLALETPNLELAELTAALESLYALPDENAQRSLLALADRARRPAGQPPPTTTRRSQQPRRCGFVPYADAILGRLEAGTMPCDGAWPAERVAVFRRWIDAGKPS